MNIGLMTHIKNQPVNPRVKNGLNSQGQLNDSQIGSQVAAGSGHILNKKLANLTAQRSLLRRGKVDQIIMAGNLL